MPARLFGTLEYIHSTAKRILERLGIQTSSSFVKIPNFKANFLFFGVCMARFFVYLETIGDR